MYSSEVKEAVVEKIKNQVSVKEIAEEFGISQATIYKWKKENIQKEANENCKIHSKKISKLIRLKKYEEAKEIGRREEFANYEYIQSQMITIAIIEGNIEEAKKIGSKKEFENVGSIQSQMITIAIREGNFEEAKKIGNRKEFANYEHIQSQMITVAIIEGNFEEAKKIGNRKEFKNNEFIQNQIMVMKNREEILARNIGQLIKREKYQEAYKLTLKYSGSAKIQSQRITILINIKRYEEAKKIGRREMFANDEHIQSQMMTIAIIEGNIEEAKEIGGREEFANDEHIQSQMIAIAIKEGNIEEAKKIGSRKELANSEIIQKQMIEIESKETEYNKEEIEAIVKIKEEDLLKQDEQVQELGNHKILNEIKTRIYMDKIDSEFMEEIKTSSELTNYAKAIILLAICEKRNMIKRARQIVLQLGAECSEIEKRNMNIILEKIKSKKTKIFDMGKYDELLHWKFDVNLFEEYKKESIDKKQNVAEEQAKEQTTYEQSTVSTDSEKETKEDKKKQKYERKQGNKFVSNKTIKNEVPKLKEKEKTNSERKNVHRKNLDSMTNTIMQYLEEKRKELYVDMQSTDFETQKRAINYWDKMEILIDKIRDSQEDGEYIQNLYNKIQNLRRKEEAR